VNSLTEPELILEGGEPIHLQIQEQLRAWIRSGLLGPGEQLPTLRALAVGLGVNPNTIARAYASLEHEGYLSTEDNSGIFVAAGPDRQRPVIRHCAELEHLCTCFLERASGNGFSPDDVLDTLELLIRRRLQP
jgi:GntR family transcriptional regulator